jgi:hypothetical protein
MPDPSHSFSFDYPNNICWGTHIINVLVMHFSHSPVTSSLLGPNNILSVLFSKSISLVPPSMRETKFHTHVKQKAKFYFCWAHLFDSRLEATKFYLLERAQTGFLKPPAPLHQI